MRDRVSTKILDNGATRYGVYDEDGKLLRYEYIKLEDEPSTEGDFFNKANMLPDRIPKLLGLKMSNPQVADALNVLANVGNLHVWERVQIVTDPIPEVPAGYTLGEETSGDIYVLTGSKPSAVYVLDVTYGDSVSVDKNGNVSIVSPTTKTYVHLKESEGMQTIRSLVGKYVTFGEPEYPDYVKNVLTGVFYIPPTATVTVSNSGASTKYQLVTGYPYTPAIPDGTTTDYLTSTDRNAYPDNVTNGQDAYYTLGDVVTGKYRLGIKTLGYSYGVTFSDSVEVLSDGIVSMPESAEYASINYSSNSVTKTYLDGLFLGNYAQLTSKSPNAPLEQDFLFTTCPSEVMFIPSDATITLESGTFYIDKYQPVTGHAAIPASTTITYLGQLGDKARIATGSYVGTGTYGSGKENTIHLPFVASIILIAGRKIGNQTSKPTFTVLTPLLGLTVADGTASSADVDTYNLVVDLSTKNPTWRVTTNQTASVAPHAQANQSGFTYFYAAFA